MVGMWEAYKLLFTNYINFSGKSSRAEYWWVQLINFIIEILLLILSIFLITFTSNGGMSVLIGVIVGYLLVSIYGLVILIPSIALTVRRYRDAGVSPWWFLVIALASFILVMMDHLSGVFYTIGLVISIIGLVITILPSKK
ncbi:DUF805 domain-containing protein [Apilactobacillus micheneri]|uniref:DUF805 domain-containing protein n=1 Tax=Apilactobacillus micheneri TaxID=1899430 RepID=UPI000D50D1E0|nr:DUF805 domain-containing protein [Apilactobacillus micheneri]GAY80360.1 inner membrane protein YhaH [Apilactobacillus micheneri]